MLKYSFYSFIAAALLGFAFAPAGGTGGIKVTLQDAATYEAIPFSAVELRKDSCGFVRIVSKSTTNMDGEAVFKDLNEGIYQVWSAYVGYHAALMKEINVVNAKTVYITLKLRNIIDEAYCEDVYRYVIPPVIDPDTRAGNTITREEYHDISAKEPVRTCFPQGEYQPDEIAVPVKVKPQTAPPSKKKKTRSKVKK